jgi:hypothetical protein
MDDLPEILAMRLLEKVVLLRADESTEVEQMLEEVNRSGAIHSGQWYLRPYELALRYAEKKVDAFSESTREFFELKAITPSEDSKEIVLPVLRNLFDALRDEMTTGIQRFGLEDHVDFKNSLLKRATKDLDDLERSARRRRKRLVTKKSPNS